MKRATARIKSASALKVETGKPWATSGKRLQSGVRQGRAVLDGQGLEEGTMQGNLVDHCGSIISCSYAQYRKLAAPEKISFQEELAEPTWKQDRRLSQCQPVHPLEERGTATGRDLWKVQRGFYRCGTRITTLPN